MADTVVKGFNIANKLRVNYVFACAGFIPFPDTNGYAEYVDVPKNSTPQSSSSWVIEYSGFGVTYAAIPTFLGCLPPSRIDVVIPDQTQWPPSLWSQLDARDSVHVSGPRVNSLGISSYLRDGLQSWSDSVENFADVYRGLSFGSTILLKNLTEDLRSLDFQILPNKAVTEPGIFLASEELRALWGYDESDMPPTIPYTKLRRLKQLSSDVILVSVSDETKEEAIMVFKSTKSNPTRNYHEIKMLLALEPAETIIGRPRHLVTIPSSGVVCGFLMTYYEGGNLEDILSERRLSGTLTHRQQLSWALDLTTSLIHIQKSPVKFYSDLRLDQLVLSRKPDGSEKAVLLDLEQSRNVYNWAPPEIYYLEWISEFGSRAYARTRDLPNNIIAKYQSILDRYLQSRDFPVPLRGGGNRYDNAANGWYWPWLTSTPTEQDAGMVYMLGKALWCLFEGIGDADIVLGRSSISDGQQRFPEFKRTPPDLQQLIKRCTAGAREWSDGHIKIYRREGKVFPLGKTGLHGEPEGTFEETKQTVTRFWRTEMQKAEDFVEARMRHDRNEAGDRDLEVLHYLQRPTLQEVLLATESSEAQLPTAEIDWVPDMATFQRRTAKRMSLLGPDAATLPKGWPKAMEHPLVWTESDLCKEDYIFNLDTVDIAEIKEALSRLKGLDVEFQDIKRSTFPLPKLGPRLESLATKVYDGIGFCVVRGLNPRHFSREDNILIYLGVSSYFGEQRGRQYQDGRMMTHITDVKFDGFPDDRRRPVFTNLAQPFHTDLLCGILVMYFIDRAAIGGDVLLASSWKVYNELASTRPDLIEVLGKDDWVHDTFGRNPPYHQRALFHYWQEKLVLIYSRRNLTGSASTPRSPNIPPLSEAQAEALDAIHFTAAANCVSHTPEAGDMVFVNNFAILHSRSTFQDTSEAKRYILRLWLNNPETGWDVPPGLRLAWDRIFADVGEIQNYWDIDPYDALDSPLCEKVKHTDDLDQPRGRGWRLTRASANDGEGEGGNGSGNGGGGDSTSCG
ncbi:Clavaminate synthase-like protein [Xylaria palmicola]|nr:Clavaminate synthase-like protein [Xylaria palmicola]